MQVMTYEELSEKLSDSVKMCSHKVRMKVQYGLHTRTVRMGSCKHSPRNCEYKRLLLEEQKRANDPCQN